MSERKVSDSEGNFLQVGSYVTYSPTGTKGNVIEIITDDEGTWALLDKTNLYYKNDVLKIVEQIEEKTLGEKIFTRDEVNEKLEKQKEFVPTEMDHSNVESGG